MAGAGQKSASRSMAGPQPAFCVPLRQEPGLGFVAGANPGRMQEVSGYVPACETDNSCYGCQTLCDAARCRGKCQQGQVSLRWVPQSMLAGIRPLMLRWQMPASTYSAMAINRLDNSPSITVKVAPATHESPFSRMREKGWGGETVTTLMIRGVLTVMTAGIRTRAGRPRDANVGVRVT